MQIGNSVFFKKFIKIFVDKLESVIYNRPIKYTYKEIKMAVFHYSRVSKEDQTVENQRLAAKQSSYIIDHWYADEGVSGGVKALDRPQFAEMMNHIQAGDTLIVSAADRIGRNTVDVISTVEKFQEMQVKVIIMAYGSLDLTSEIGMVVLSVAATFAQMERNSLKARTKAGIERTRSQGTKLGAPLKITPKDLKTMKEMADKGDNLNKIGSIFGFPRNTVERNLALWGDKLEEYKVEYNKRAAQYSSNKAN